VESEATEGGSWTGRIARGDERDARESGQIGYERERGIEDDGWNRVNENSNDARMT